MCTALSGLSARGKVAARFPEEAAAAAVIIAVTNRTLEEA